MPKPSQVGPDQSAIPTTNEPPKRAPFTRSMIVDNKLVMVSYGGLVVVALDTLAPIGSVNFAS